jgi:hypothetical protein
MNSNIENYQVNDEVDPTKKLTLINPNLLLQDTNTPPPIPVLPRTASENFEVAILEEPLPEELEEVGKAERAAEEAYDLAFTKYIIEKFPNIYPPEPPKSEINNSEMIKNFIDDNKFYSKKFNEFEDKIGDGKFEYISDIWEREMLVNAWQAITSTNNWDFVAQSIGSFMWSTDPRINQISIQMERLGYTGHSGCSFGCTMRNMQYLAQHGESKFKELFYLDDDNANEVSDPEIEPYENEDAMEYEQRLKEVIKRRVEKKKAEDKLLEYMGGY